MHRFDTTPTHPTPEQLLLIERQIGRAPRGIEAIACQTEAGIPLVLQMRSLLGDTPFPTLYWLCSKDLSVAISRLEDAGWVKRIEQELQRDEALRHTFHAQQQRYVERRQVLMRAPDRARLEQKGLAERFARHGIGGIARWDKVRCLHMQYAHWLAEGDNVIGERLEQAFELSRIEIRL
jgi:hypothetical protein